MRGPDTPESDEITALASRLSDRPAREGRYQ